MTIFTSNRCAALTILAVSVVAVIQWSAGSELPPGRCTSVLEPASSPSASVAVSVSETDAPSRQEVERLDGYYTACVGTVLKMQLSSRQQSRVRGVGSQDAAELVLTAGGSLRLSVKARRPGNVILGFAFDDMALGAIVDGQAADPGETAALRLHLKNETEVLMADDGRVLGWRFPTQSPPQVRSWIRGVFALVRFVCPERDAAAWHTSEEDPSGEYAVDYRRLADRDARWCVVRQRTALRPWSAVGPSAGATVRDEASAKFDPNLGWLVAAECDEAVNMRVDAADLDIEASSHASLLLESACVEGVEGSPNWDSPWESPHLPPDCSEDDAERARADDEALVAGVSVDELLVQLSRCCSTPEPTPDDLLALRRRIVAALRVRPNALEAVERMVRDGSLNETSIGVALSAVGDIASPAAQALLTSVAADKTKAAPVRVYAVLGMFQVGEPDSGLQSTVHSLCGDVSEPAPLRSTALLLLGAQAKASEERFRALQELAPTSSTDPMFPAFLEAVANAGYDEVLETYVGHESSAVRELAARILARRRGALAEGSPAR